MNSSLCQQWTNNQKEFWLKFNFEILIEANCGNVKSHCAKSRIWQQIKICDWSCEAWAALQPCMNMTFLDAVQLISIRQPRLLKMWGGHVAMWGWAGRGDYLGMSPLITWSLGGYLIWDRSMGSAKMISWTCWHSPNEERDWCACDEYLKIVDQFCIR